MKKYKRIVSMLLVCCLLITLFPTTGLALEMTSQAASEESTEGDSPNRNSTVEPVYKVRDDVSASLTPVATTSEIEVAYPVEGGNIYLDLSSGTITRSDYTVTNVVIPTDVEGVPITTIGSRAFRWCEDLTSVTLSKNITNIEYDITESGSPFYRCSSLTELLVAENNANFISVNGVLFSKDQTALYCYPLGREDSEYAIPENVINIMHGAFWYGENLTSITIPENVVNIGNSAFEGCSNLTSISLPNSVKNLGRDAFQDCSNLTDITIGGNVSKINSGTFWGCTSLACITISDSVTSIDSSAFYGCENLTDIYIGGGVSDIYLYGSVASPAFSGCINLENITVSSQNAVYSSEDGVLFDKEKQILYYYPRGKMQTTYSIPSSVIKIEQDAFSGCNRLTSIIIPDGVQTIGSSAFQGCSNLKNILIPNSVTDIWSGAFQNCYELTNVVLSTQLTEISYGLFKSCRNITDIIIPTGITSVDNEAFSYCEKLTSITIPDSVSTIGNYTFDNCNSLQDIYYLGNQSQWETLKIGNYNDSLYTATIHYNSVGPSDTETANSSVQFFSSWDPSINQAFFDNSLLAYSVTENTDLSSVSSIDQLVGKYVLVEMDQTNVLEIASIRPVDSKIGVVKDVIVGNGDPVVTSLQFDDGTYAVVDGLISYEELIGKTVLYHLYSEEIYGFEVLEEKTGIFGGWDNTTKTVLIDDTEYPTNYLSDLSFIDKADEMKNMVVKFYAGDGSYAPIFEIIDCSYPGGNLSDFNAAVYHANFLQKDGNPSVENINREISGPTPSEEMVNLLKENGFEPAVAGWEAFELVSETVDDITALYDFAAEPKDLYTAVILNALEASISYNLVESNFEDAIKDCDQFVSEISELMKLEFSIDLRSNFSSMTTGQKDYLEKITERWFTREYPEIAELDEVFQGVTKAFDLVDSVENYYEYIVSCVTVANLGEDMKAVLRQAYQDSLKSNNLPLQLALLDCVEVMDSSVEELVQNIIRGVYSAVGEDACKYLIKELLWSKVTETLYASCPAAAVFQTAYKTGKYISNLLFNTDDTIEQYLKMLAITDTESLIDDTYQNLKENFQRQKDVENAAIYLCALDLVFSLRNEDTIRADGFVDILDESLANKIMELFGQDTYSDTKEYLRIRQAIYADQHNAARTAWIPELETDYPGSGLYERYDALYNGTEAQNLAKEFVVACPVNVYIYDQGDNLIASCIDGRIFSNGDVMIASQGDTKIVRIYEGASYRMELVGTDIGDMEITISEFDKNEETVRTVNYHNVPLKKGSIYTTEVDSQILSRVPYELIATESGSYIKYDYDSLLSETAKPHTISVVSGTLIQNDELFLSTKAYEGETLRLYAIVPEGCQFVRWEVTDGNALITDLFADSTTVIMPAEDIQITAILSGQVAHNHTITFDANGGYINISSALTGESGKLSSLPTPNRDGYTFNGWYTAASGGSRVTTDTVFDVDTTVYAQWSKIDNSEGSPSGEPSTSSGSSGTTRYNVAVASDIEGGSVKVSPIRTSRGDTVTITVDPDAGYELGTLVVTDSRGNRIDVERQSDTRYTFEMPSGRVTVEATFVEVTEEPSPTVLPFTDVPASAWYYDAVEFVYERGMMAGTGNNQFSPNVTTTRAMIVTILHRLENQPAAGSSSFTDVPAGQWYTDAVTWAAANGIVGGYGDGRFGPNDTITREQMAVILYRYAQFKGYDVSNTGNLSRYTDAGQVSTWARTAMGWANAQGLITGNTATTLNPTGSATRAEVATILMRFCEDVAR